MIGGSATMAVDVLKSRGVPEDRILFVNLIASPEGINVFAKKFPKLRVVTAFIDQVCIPNKSELSVFANRGVYSGIG
jgi:uracil phosphoribosyltransferase